MSSPPPGSRWTPPPPASPAAAGTIPPTRSSAAGPSSGRATPSPTPGGGPAGGAAAEPLPHRPQNPKISPQNQPPALREPPRTPQNAGAPPSSVLGGESAGGEGSGLVLGLEGGFCLFWLVLVPRGSRGPSLFLSFTGDFVCMLQINKDKNGIWPRRVGGASSGRGLRAGAESGCEGGVV